MMRGYGNLAIEALCRYSVVKMERIPKDEFDYGDEETVHANLKRVNFDINSNSGVNDAFGVYCGKLGKKYIVGIMGMRAKYDFHSSELFDSLEDMKKEWQLD